MAMALWQAEKIRAALITAGATPEQAATWFRRAATKSGTDAENAEAEARVAEALQNKGLPYTPLERSRLLEEGLPIPPDYAFWVAIVYMMKNEPKMLENLAEKFMDAQARIIGSLAQAGAGNIITAYSHSFLISLMLEQNYMIRQRGADDLIVSLNVLVGAQALTNLLQGFAVPEVLTFAATGVPISPIRIPKGGLPSQEKGK
jgi:hypothetical protein